MHTNFHRTTDARSPNDMSAGLIWFAEQCIDNGAPLESYVQHAERIGDRELAMFFRRALAESRRLRPGERRRGPRRVRNDRRRG
jgi:hypothetical protein